MAGVKIAGVILAGGAGARMGAEKPLLPFRGASLVEAVMARIGPQVRPLAVEVAPDCVEAYRRRLDAEILPDLYTERLGPLCGIVTGLSWCEGGWLATFPCDTPFLPADLVAQLAVRADSRPVVVRGAQVCGLWPKTCLDELKAGLDGGRLRSVLGAVEHLGGAVVDIDAAEHAFFNVNTPEDLERAEGFRDFPHREG
jgi:molybdopterin-guanine dinucleotide biosynthesis protein A